MPGLGQEDSGFTLPGFKDDSETPLVVEPLPYVPSERIIEHMRLEALDELTATWEGLIGCDE